MKVRVTYTTEVPEWWRRAIRCHYGLAGLASREEIVSWLKTYGTSMDDDLAMMDQGMVSE